MKELLRGDREPLRHGAGHRADRLRQDHDAVLRAVARQHARSQRDDRRGPGRVQPRRHQPGAGARGRRPHASPRRSRRSCARTPTSSWSARSATSRPRRSRSRRRSPATSCCRRCTPTTPRARSAACIDMGIEPFLVASSVNLVLGPAAGARACARPASGRSSSIDEVLRELQLDAAGGARPRTSSEGAGCVDCSNTGYRGRQGVYEVMPMTPQHARPDPGARARRPRSSRPRSSEGMLTLRRDALEKLKRGRHDRGRSAQGDGGGRSCSRDRPLAAGARTSNVVTLRQLLEDMVQREGLGPAHHGRRAARVPDRRLDHAQRARGADARELTVAARLQRAARTSSASASRPPRSWTSRSASKGCRASAPTCSCSAAWSRWRSGRSRTRSCRSRSSGCRRWCASSRTATRAWC